MPTKERYTSRSGSDIKTVPFESAQEAWFWFISAQQAKNDGARFAAGQGRVPRPCEPIDILRILDRLYRTRRVTRDHLLVLRHYGRRQMPPDPRRVKEIRSHSLWLEALDRLGVALENRGIVRRHAEPNPNWYAEAFVLSNGFLHEGASA